MGVKRPSDAAAGPARAVVPTEAAATAEPSRLFVVCGRGRQLDELRALFSACGRIRHLHLALDRSNKSRGFAFLQYEDPMDATRAIERFDQMTLDDGHVLKVTVAKEKPNGKLKRDQHARHEAEVKTGGRPTGEEEAGIDGHTTGKRQRSSPPQSILPSPRGVASLSLPLEPANVGAVDDTSEVRKVKRERIAENRQVAGERNEELSVDAASSPQSTDRERQSIVNTLEDILTALNNHIAARVQDPRHLFASYLKAKASRSEPAPVDSLSMLGGTPFTAPAQRALAVTAKMEESTTDMITSSIGSVSLTGNPSAHSLRSTAAHNAPVNRAFVSSSNDAHRSGKPMLRRRRQSTDESDSSGEDGQDGGGNRRKRSNTTVTPPPQGTPSPFIPSFGAEGNMKIESPAQHSAVHGICTPSENIDPAAVARKQYKRQSSADVHDGAFRSAKQQVTGSGRHSTELNPQAAGSDSVDALSTAFGSLARSRLFFVSTHKFTLQELEAMFSVYGDFEWVQIVKSFGRIKTMAYIKYSHASTAAEVVQSFESDAAVGDQRSENGDFIKLTFADSVRLGHSAPASVELQQPRRDSMDSFTARGELVELDEARRLHERLWLLLLFDRIVPNHSLSSTVTACPGMEFIDIKLSKVSGDSQGVAFAKFATEQYAVEAARELHQTELPIGSGKSLQALVISDPSQFSTAYGQGAVDASGSARLAGGAADDVDVGAVEARFAHLMRGNGSDHHYSSQSLPDQRQFSYDQSAEPRVTGNAYDGLPSMGPMFPGAYLLAAQGEYASSTMYGTGPSSSGMPFYPTSISMPPPPYHPYQSLPPAPAMYGSQSFGFNGWVDPSQAVYYPHYFPAASAPQRPEIPVLPMRMEQSPSFEDMRNESDATERAQSKTDRSPPSPSSSDVSMGSSESTNSNGARAKPLMVSVSVSSSQPMDFVAIVSALRDCSGMIAFRKDSGSGRGDGCAYVAQFVDEAQARAAIVKLDGTNCQGGKLRVGLVNVSSGARSGKWGSGASSRRKRQRVDARSKGRSDG